MKALLAGMALLAVVFGAGSGRMEAVNAAVLEEGSRAVSLVITLTGSLCFWSGLMEVAGQAGITRWIARLLRPVTRRLFPALAEDSETLEKISLNMTANLLGLGNAATPLGLDAMERLARRAPEPGVASGEMITLMVLNTCSLQLIPATTAALRLAAGSKNAMEILPPMLAASGTALLAAVGLSLVISRRFSRGRRM